MSSPATSKTSKSHLLEKYKEPDADFAPLLDSSEEVNLSYSKFSHFSGLSSSKSELPSNSDLFKEVSPFIAPSAEFHNGSGKFMGRGMEPILEISDTDPVRLETPEPVSEFSLSQPPFLKSSPHMHASKLVAAPQAHARKLSVKMSLTPAQRVEKHAKLRSFNALDDFEFYERVGRGAFADVYRGLNKKTNQVVAIKQIRIDRDYDLNALMGEIDLLKILKHANIVKYHGFVKTLSSLNVFLEFCAGGSLRQVYKRQGFGFTESQIARLVVPILNGLSYLHEQGVVHRDVKAANVLVTEAGDVKLADFGVATKVANSHNTAVGTPNWMAPETVLGGDGICTASDIWSLGATVIELFTTNPPYHDLNPMAALHAIGTDEHPPLPPGLSPSAKDFLLECFQKQPSLRTSAVALLKHPWLTRKPHVSNSTAASTLQALEVGNVSEKSNGPAHGATAGNSIDSKDNSSIRFEEKELQTQSLPTEGYSRSELLSKFTERNEESFNTTQGQFPEVDVQKIKQLSENGLLVVPHSDEDVHDPFFDVEFENFDTNELDIKEKMDILISKLRHKVSNYHHNTADVTTVLVKLTGRISYLLKKYPASHDVFSSGHGVILLMELLENAPDMIDQTKLWYHVLSALNCFFSKNIAQIENFALLGGIPMVTTFSKLSFGVQIRLQVVKFVKILRKSEKAMLMFVSSGGLRVLSRFLEEDFDVSPEFSLVAVNCIHEVLAKGLTRFKSDMCRILSKYGIVFWFVVLLNRLTKSHKLKSNVVPDSFIELTIDNILEVIRFFGQSEPRVRINISNPDLFKLIIKVFPSLNFSRQLIVLKFLRSMSCITELLRPLNSADILEFYVNLLRQYGPTNPHYKEVLNVVCPSLYNCCYLNHSRERELIKLGALPILCELSRVNLPFRQFILPLLCEFVYCDASIYPALRKNNVLGVYCNLLVDPYWNYNAVDSILHWSFLDPTLRWLESPVARDCLVGGFMMSRVSNLEAVLENYLRLVNSEETVLQLFSRESVVENIADKLNSYKRQPAAKLTLLRILLNLVNYLVQTSQKLESMNRIMALMETIASDDPSVLVKDLAGRITQAGSVVCT